MISNRQRYPLTDESSTLSLLLDWTEGAAEQSFLVIVPMQSQTLDGRAGEAALFADFEDCNLYAPDGVRVQLNHADIAPPGGPHAIDPESGVLIDPMRDVRYTLQFVITFPAGTVAAENNLFAVYGHTIATATPAPEAWPVIAALPAPGGVLTVKTAGGSPVPARIALLP